jgi:hypothetical protein
MDFVKATSRQEKNAHTRTTYRPAIIADKAMNECTHRFFPSIIYKEPISLVPDTLMLPPLLSDCLKEIARYDDLTH